MTVFPTLIFSYVPEWDAVPLLFFTKYTDSPLLLTRRPEEKSEKR